MSLYKRAAEQGLLPRSGTTGVDAASNLALTWSAGESIKDIENLMLGLTGKLEKDALRKGTRAGAHIVLREARRLAPERTGAILRSLRVRAIARKFQRATKTRGASIGHVVLTSREWFRGDLFYAAFVELGTKKRYSKSARRTFHPVARDEKGKFVSTDTSNRRIYRGLIDGSKWSYLRRALYTKGEAILEASRDAIREWLENKATR